MPAWLLLLVLVLATFRLTRLVTRDDFPPILWLRNWIQQRRPTRYVYDAFQTNPRVEYWWLGELVGCHWCASAYLAAGLVWLTDLTVGMPAPWLAWLAVWAGAALIADRA